MAKVVIGAEVKVSGKEAEQSVKSFKQQLREANAELIKLSEKFGATSKEAVNAAKKVASLKDAIGDAKELANSFNPDAKFAAFSGAIQGAVSGFSALQGAQALFGSQSKDLEQTLVKVQAALALSQGINGIFAAKDAFVNLAAVIKTNVISAFGSLRAALISTGIGALAVGVGLLISNFDKVKKALVNLIPGLGTFSDWVGKTVDKVTEWLGITDDQIDSQKALEEATKDLTAGLSSYYNEIDRVNKIEILRAKIAGQSDASIEKIEKSAVDRKVKQVDGLIKLAKQYGISAAALEGEREKLLQEQEVKSYENRLKEADRFREEQKRREEERKKQAEGWAKQMADIAAGNYQFMKIDKPKIDRSFVDEAKDLLTKQVSATKDLLKQDSENREAAYNRNVQAGSNALAELKRQQEAEQASRLATYGVVASAAENFANLIGKQTAAGKALAIAAATINTYKAASEALKADYGVFGPAAQVARVLTVASVIATGLQQVRAIAAVRVPGGGGGTPSISAPSAAQLAPQATTTTLDQNSINSIGNAAGRAFVLETDVTNNQERIRRLNRAARIN
jgi:hypothetical protein